MFSSQFLVKLHQILVHSDSHRFSPHMIKDQRSNSKDCKFNILKTLSVAKIDRKFKVKGVRGQTSLDIKLLIVQYLMNSVPDGVPVLIKSRWLPSVKMCCIDSRTPFHFKIWLFINLLLLLLTILRILCLIEIKRTTCIIVSPDL
jgi:hypothetical protein